MTTLPIHLDPDRLAAFCRKWMISEFSVFGSVLRGDFQPDSDVDVLVTFQPDERWSLWDLIEMRDELAAWVGRDVDLIEKEAITNPYRRHRILSTARLLYAA
jgi:predicted nucleotidyltransferase